MTQIKIPPIRSTGRNTVTRVVNRPLGSCGSTVVGTSASASSLTSSSSDSAG